MADKRVTLVDPQGQEYSTSSIVEINDLVYGHGYRIKQEAPAKPQAKQQTKASSEPASAQ